MQIIADSPMLQGMAMLINSPLAAAAGMKTVVIGGRPMSYAPNDNSYMTLVGGKTICDAPRVFVVDGVQKRVNLLSPL